jgi:predicted ATPase
MTRFILTGAPGSGKTAIIRQLELDGFSVVEEAATDVIALKQAQGVAEPWRHPLFIDSIVELQRLRQAHASSETEEIQFHDRSAICTAALAAYLGYPPSDVLSRELTRLEEEAVFQRRVFFIENLGFIEPTQSRRISLEDALRFERVHEETYRKYGFERVFIAPGSLSDRVDAIKRAVSGAAPSLTLPRLRGRVREGAARSHAAARCGSANRAASVAN